MIDQLAVPERCGEVRTVSHLPLIGFLPPFGSVHQCQMSPQRNGPHRNG
jgi:hypothetical protein